MKYMWVLLLFMSAACYSAQHGSASGQIDNITIKETGYIHIRFESNHANTIECEVANTVVIASTNPNRDQMLSLALTAFAGGYVAGFWITGCYEYYNTSYSLATTVGVSK